MGFPFTDTDTDTRSGTAILEGFPTALTTEDTTVSVREAGLQDLRLVVGDFHRGHRLAEAVGESLFTEGNPGGGEWYSPRLRIP